MASGDTETHCNLTAQTLVAAILPPVLIVELLVGLPGNLMALWVFCHHLRSWRPNVVFLFNLAVSDFLLLVSLPFRIHYNLRSENWVFGNAWCRINLFMLAVNRSASIGFMTAVAVNRYFKVVHPHHEINFISSLKVAGIACFIWTVVISLRLPLLTNDLLNKKNNITFCRSFNNYSVLPKGILVHYVVYLSEFFLSLMVLLFCSLRIYCILRQHQTEKKKKFAQAIRIVLVIVGIFILCFFPGVATGVNVLYLTSLRKECEVIELSSQLFVLALGFTYLNSVLDPVIYGFCSSMFRDALKRSAYRLVGLKLTPSRRATNTEREG
ncbi:hydroxycarboxylic acid receptor 3-like [Salminus brasiliensis]|uniref:hydroxycarboxylic acid receptor 3-like n=1 Tax=Salminus brasiliensis TaxID=930266 RepID=UPI003B834183